MQSNHVSIAASVKCNLSGVRRRNSNITIMIYSNSSPSSVSRTAITVYRFNGSCYFSKVPRVTRFCTGNQDRALNRRTVAICVYIENNIIDLLSCPCGEKKKKKVYGT